MALDSAAALMICGRAPMIVRILFFDMLEEAFIGEAKIAIICENQVIEQFHIDECSKILDVFGERFVLFAWLQLSTRMVVTKYDATCCAAQGILKNSFCICNCTVSTTDTQLIDFNDFIGKTEVQNKKLFVIEVTEFGL